MILLLLACKPGYDLDAETIRDARECQECHPAHYQEWSGSMHAYAAEDPVFIAMNERGQRETDGELGDFCIKCHAPIAVREGLTTDGLNVAELPVETKGVTCYYCHSVVDVTDTHNAPLTLADDLVLRGGLGDAVENPAHASTYSPLHDRDDLRSAQLCGACHDIVTPLGVELERTYQEWRSSLYAGEVPGRQQTCGNCHMQGYDGTAADFDGVLFRRVHRHTFAAVDMALTDFPEKEAQAAEIQATLDTTLLSQLEVCQGTGGLNISYILENVAAGHMFPSGAAQDRRVWAEVVAYQGDEVIWSTGVIADDEPLLPSDDPDLWRFGDDLYGADGELVHMFWEAHSLESYLLPPPVPAGTDTHIPRTWVLGELYPTRVTARVRLRAVGLDVIDSLVASGDLDPQYRDRLPILDLGAATAEWSGLIDLCP